MEKSYYLYLIGLIKQAYIQQLHDELGQDVCLMLAEEDELLTPGSITYASDTEYETIAEHTLKSQ